MTKKPYTFADLRTIVPAVTPAWLRIIEAYEVEEEDKSKTKEWSDIVVPVLAYATLPDGEGAFLIYDNNDNYPSGPTWIVRNPCGNQYMDSKVRLELSIGTPPTKGTPCVITEGYKYVPTELSPLEAESILWVI